MCDQISDAIVDEALRQDPESRAAIETGAKNGGVMVFGEMTTKGYIDVPRIVRQVIKDIGYTDARFGIDYETCSVWSQITEQSPDISQGVSEGIGKEQGAGDQGSMYAYACNETAELMPLPIMLAHKLAKKLAEVRKSNGLSYLRPDGKSQVSIEYENGKPLRATSIVISAQHNDGIEHREIKKDIIEKVIRPICENWIDENTEFHVNPTGSFVRGGPYADAGVTGRKIIVDTYGGVGRHGGGAFCIAGDSRVNTGAGTLRIADCKEVMGKLVKTDIHPIPAGEWWDNGLKETMIVSTVDGYKLEATPDHNVRVLDSEGNYIWRELGKINDNDFIPIQKMNRLFGNGDVGTFSYAYKDGTSEKRKKQYILPGRLTDDYAYLLGLLVGDGDCTDEGCIKICICEEEQKTNVQNLFQRLFGNKGKVYGHWAYIGGVELRAYLEFLGLKKVRATDKNVPEAIWHGTKSNIAAFLKGLFDTDGCVRIDGRNKTTPRIHLATTSKLLAEEIQTLLLNFGIISKIYKADSVGKISYINGRKVTSRHALYNLTIKGAESVQSFKKEIGFGLSRKTDILNKIDLQEKIDRITVPNQRKRIIKLFKKLPIDEQKKDVAGIARFTRKSEGKATKELTYEKLNSFISAYENLLKGDPEFEYLKELSFMKHYYTKVRETIPSFTRTYDLNIPLTHTFTANGFVVHNSGKDPTKVDRSGAYMARYIAKNIVGAGLADKCEVHLAYIIGIAEPASVHIDCFNTNKIPEEKIQEIVREVFPLKPKEIIETLQLRRPIYRKTAAYGHFGRSEEEFTWEKLDKVDALRAKAGI